MHKLHRFVPAALLALAFAAQAGDIQQPRPGLYTAGQPSLAQLDALRAQGVRTVIDLRTEGEDRGYDETAELKSRGLTYRRLPIAGAQDLTPANAAALQRLLAESDGKVLLHCASSNRVGALLALMAAQREGVAPEQALELGKRAGLKSLTPTVENELGLAPTKPTPSP